jgi:hypothetical protein
LKSISWIASPPPEVRNDKMGLRNPYRTLRIDKINLVIASEHL